MDYGPATQQIQDTSDLVIGACAMAKLSGGGDKLVELCGTARDAFAKQLGVLVDTETQQLIDGAQARVDAALRPPRGSSAGSDH